MAMLTLWRAVRGRWHDLVEAVWPASPEERTRAEIARLGDELAHGCRRLLRLARRIEQVRTLLERQQRLLNETAPESAAVQRSVERLRDRLSRLEQFYDRRRQQIERRKRLRAALMSGQVCVVEDIPSPPLGR